MAINYIDFQGDPSNSDAITSGDYVHIKTISAGGTYPDLVCPASPNFPAGTPAKYKVNLPGIPFVDGSHAMVIKDHTSGDVVLTLNASFPPGTGKYWLAPSGSKTPDVLFLDSGQAGHVISIDYYSSGSIVHAQDINNININGNILAGGNVSAIGNVLANNGMFLQRKKYTMGNTYNGVPLTVAITNPSYYSLTRGEFMPYQLIDGSWRCVIDISFSITTMNDNLDNISISGISVGSDGLARLVPFSVLPRYTSYAFPSYVGAVFSQVFNGATNRISILIRCASGGALYYAGLSVDVELDSKPTWAD